MEGIKQSGLIVLPPSPSDYVAGVYTTIPEQTRVADGNWKKYLPSTEAQSAFTFDTFACTTFSALNSIETQVNFLIQEKVLSSDQVARIKALGFIDAKGRFNASDRFTAIMSGTTANGNDFITVWKSIKKYGLLPESDLPFNVKSFTEYYDTKKITEEMKTKALAILDVLTFQFEWVFFDSDPRLQGAELEATEKALKQAPLHIAMPIPAHHATLMYNLVENDYYEAFDTYTPFYFEDDWAAPIHFALKGYVTPNIHEPYVFTKDLYAAVRDPEVAQLQKRLNQDPDTRVAISGPGSPGNETSFFGPATGKAVIAFQKKNGIMPNSGYVGSLTRKVLNGTESPSRSSVTSKLDAWCEAIKLHEGWFAPGDNPLYPRGTPSYRNNNPGNLRYVGQRRAKGRSADNFCIFATYDDGYSELKDMLIRAASGGSKNYSPNMTLFQFYAGIPNLYPGYAPSSDNNDPLSYATAVAKRLGVDITTQIKNLL